MMEHTQSESKRRTTLLLGSLWVVLGNLWEMATGSGDADAATQPGADCISQPLKPHSALLPCTDCRERIGVENQLASGHTWRGAHTRGQVSLSQMLFTKAGSAIHIMEVIVKRCATITSIALHCIWNPTRCSLLFTFPSSPETAVLDLVVSIFCS